MFPLLLLANELVQLIVESISDRPTLISLAQTCSKLQSLAEAQLFKVIHIRKGALTTQLCEVLEANPARFEYVQTLEATPSPYGYQGIELMPQLVQRMRKLRELRVESPQINAHRFAPWWTKGSVAEYMDMFGIANDLTVTEAPLRYLTAFTFHSNGVTSRFYDVQRIWPIFRSRTLRFLHVSCIRAIDFQQPYPASEIDKTPLETLVLEECDISSIGLANLLALPKALASLSIRERMRHSGPRLLNIDVGSFLAALSQQSHSLRFFQHDCAIYGSGDELLLGANDEYSGHGLVDISTTFSIFAALTTLELHWTSSLVQALRLARLAPPGLEVFRLTGLRYAYEGFWEHMARLVGTVSSNTAIKHLELHLASSYVSGRLIDRTLMDNTSISKELVAVARIMKSRNSTTRLVMHERVSGVIPPYLFGERGPVDRICFDSELFWEEEQRYARMVAEGRHVDEETLKRRQDDEDEHYDDAQHGTMLAAQIITGYLRSEA